MEALMNIIIWVCVIVAFVQKLKVKNKSDDSRGSQRPGSTKNSRNLSETRTAKKAEPAVNVPRSQQKVSRKTTEPLVNVPRAQQDMSTTEYLQYKANLDAQAHRKEKYQEWQRARQETGGLPAAKRLYEGDSVPNGMWKVKCSYCGADNLVPEETRQRYTCYFCREEL